MPNDEVDDFDGQITAIVESEDQKNHKRLDTFLVEKINSKSRSFIKKIFQQDLISWDEHSPHKGKLELKKLPPIGSIINIHLPPPIPSEAMPEELPLKILFEDEHLLIVDKEAGMVTHPAPGNYSGTLVNAILHHCQDLKGVGNVIRPGIVHRLDKGTSGVMVVAKTQEAHEGLVLLFSTHDIERKYEALVMGVKIPPHGKVESTIGRNPNNRLKMKSGVKVGKNAITHFKVLDIFDGFSHLEFTLETGRTHQIRVHASEVLKCPLLCDPTYGNKTDQLKRLKGEMAAILKDYDYALLHAKTLGFVHPITKEKLSFTTEPPEKFKEVLEMVNKVK